jgi:hypothetical protein
VAEERAYAGGQWQEHDLVLTTSVGRRMSLIICGGTSAGSRGAHGTVL